jgi:hypothetical protein
MNISDFQRVQIPDFIQEEAVKKANVEKMKQIVINTAQGYLIVSLIEYINIWQANHQVLAYALPQM